jgi:hypothetical protein
MSKTELKKLIQELVNEVLSEYEDGTDEVLAERSAQARANKENKRRREMLRAMQNTTTDQRSQMSASGRAAAVRNQRAIQRATPTGGPFAPPGYATPAGGRVQSRSLATRLDARAQGLSRFPDAPTVAKNSSQVAVKAAQKGLKKIPGTFGLYSKSGSSPAEFRSVRGMLLRVKGLDNRLAENATGMIRLTELLREAKENRINLMRISTLMEKVIPEITEPQSKKLTELFAETSMLVTNLNSMPYTKFNINEWQVMLVATYAKLNEFRQEVIKISETATAPDCKVLINALDEVFNY